MQNYFAHETEAAFRRQEWQRAITKAEQTAQARLSNTQTRCLHPLRLALRNLRSIAAPELRLPAWNTLQTAIGRSAPGPWKEVVHQ
jgi:hypothetical protein